MRFILLMIFTITIAGCSSSSPNQQKRIPPKIDPYEGSVLDSIKQNQNIYREQQISKPRY
ncbi:hypothetical protein [Providencia manganoxydans]|uniref:Lipoprotein n=1 Tax=Providencia stuartii TaxID=588 RepID=A0A1S1HNA6_PROST|nr:hypothetical protein A3Q29_09650 [Providencia stuartii]